eukprot:gene26390-17568_t
MLAIAALVSSAAAFGPKGNSKKNVLYFIADDLRPEFAAPYWQKQMITPNVDKLAASGLTFTNAYGYNVGIDTAAIKTDVLRDCMEKVLPGQINISAADYAKITDTQTTELWTQYGNLTEVWVDSALGGMGQKMQRLQPQA